MRRLERLAADGDQEAIQALERERLRRDEAPTLGRFSLLAGLGANRWHAYDPDAGQEVLLVAHRRSQPVERLLAQLEGDENFPAQSNRHPEPAFLPWRSQGWESAPAGTELLLTSPWLHGEDLSRPEVWGGLPLPARLERFASLLSLVADLHRAERALGYLDFLGWGPAGVALRQVDPIRDPGRAGSPWLWPVDARFRAPESLGDLGMSNGPARQAEHCSSHDVWLLGVTLFRALSGQELFPAVNRALVLQALAKAPIPRLPWRLPAALRRVCRRALERDPARRFADALELQQAFASAS